jgi:hypothetical protein
LYDTSGYFGINSSNGMIFIRKALDFESQPTLTLIVRAYDKKKASPGRARRQGKYIPICKQNK